MIKEQREASLKKGQNPNLSIHSLELKARKELLLNGVSEVFNVSDTIVAVNTLQGGLVIEGNDMALKSLDLDLGKMSIEGLVVSISYQILDKKKRFWQRIFK